MNNFQTPQFFQTAEIFKNIDTYVSILLIIFILYLEHLPFLHKEKYSYLVLFLFLITLVNAYDSPGITVLVGALLIHLITLIHHVKTKSNVAFA